MQDRYVGDIGDFYKFGLLRRLVGPPVGRLGVVWYRTVDETHNSDGKFVDYLDVKDLRGADERLFDCLADLVRSGRRSVAALESSGVLPVGTRFHNDLLAS